MSNNSLKIDVEIDITPALKKIAPLIVKDLKKAAPKNRGNYKDDFSFTIKNKTLFVYNENPLAHILEFGSGGIRGQAAQPHFRVVLKKWEKQYPEYIKKYADVYFK